MPLSDSSLPDCCKTCKVSVLEWLKEIREEQGPYNLLLEHPSPVNTPPPAEHTPSINAPTCPDLHTDSLYTRVCTQNLKKLEIEAVVGRTILELRGN